MHKIMTQLAALLCLLLISKFSMATTFKIATLSPEGSYWMKTMRAAGKDIAAKTNDRVRFRFYPGGVMGSDTAVLQKIRLGQLQGAALSGGALNLIAPDTQVYSLPRLFRSYAEVDYVRSRMDPVIEKEFENKGWVNFGLAEGGFAYLMSKSPITNITELPKYKVWIPSGDSTSEIAASNLNVTPTPLSIGDVLASLQTGLINTVFASPIAAIALQWHTQISYITDAPLVYFYALLAIQDKAFNKLSAEDQATVRTIMTAAFKAIDKQNRKDNEAAFAALKKQGIKILTPTQTELATWNSKTMATTKTLIENGTISKGVYDKIGGLLKEYRQTHAENPKLTAPAA